MASTARRILLIIALILGGLLVAPGRAEACSCVAPTDPSEYEGRADAVFEGRALAVRNGPRSDPPSSGDPVIYTFRVDRPVKGDFTAIGADWRLDVSTPQDSGTCGQGFRIPARYRVFARRTPEGLVTSSCSGNTHLGDTVTGIAARPQGDGYWLGVQNMDAPGLGAAPTLGFIGGISAPGVGLAVTPSGGGVWTVSADGGVFSWGDAAYFGSVPEQRIRLTRPAVGMAATRSGDGYWLAAADGGVFTFGAAPFHGSAGAVRLAAPIVGIAATPSGSGYWLVAGDGGVFTYGDAHFFGSAAGRAGDPVVAMAVTHSGNGYRLVTARGAVFRFGDATEGDTAPVGNLSAPIRGIANAPGGGYWLVDRDGRVFPAEGAPDHGSMF